MTTKPDNFVCACDKHGIKVHGGEDPECCDAGVILPMLTIADVERLNLEGRKMYRSDMLALADLVESGAVSLDGVENVASWYKYAGFPLVAEEFEVATRRLAEVGSEPVESIEEGQPFNPDAYYMAGFEQGFSMGFEKGFDTGHKLSVNGKK